MSVSGKLARPSTPAAGTRRSQHTTMPSGASRMPSNCRSKSRRADSGAKRSACASRSRSAMDAARSRVAESRTTTKRQGCEWPTEGAACAASRMRRRTSAGTGSGRNRLMSRRARSTSCNASRSVSPKAQPLGSTARDAALVLSPISGTGRVQVTGRDSSGGCSRPLAAIAAAPGKRIPKAFRSRSSGRYDEHDAHS